MSESGPYLPTALFLAVALGVLAFFLGAGVNASMVVAVGAVAAVLVAAIGQGRDPGPLVAETAAQRGAQSATRELADAVDEPLMIVADGRITLANVAARTLLGEHVVGEDVRLAIRHPAAAERLYAGDLGGGDDAPVELVGIGGREQNWAMHVRPLSQGRRLVRLSDRTDNRAAERMRVDFVANASHELRTPLASLLGFIETLREEAGDDPQVRNRFLKVMFDEARRMQRLIDDLISLSRIEATKYREPSDPVALAPIVAEAENGLRSTHGLRGGDLVVDIEDGLGVRGDRAQLSQLLYNIIGNALKYGRHGEPVTLSAIRQGAFVCVVVTDRGEGIAPAHIPRLTERFYRVDSGRSRALGGTGLGLAIVKHIVERHRGQLRIQSVVGEGTTVTVQLPAIDVIKP